MRIKDFYNLLKTVARTNPDYQVVSDIDFSSFLKIRIDDEHKEIVLEFYRKTDCIGKQL